MARAYRVRDLEAQHGDLHQVIPPLVNKNGQAEAARELGVSQFTISRWLKDNGYERRTVYQLNPEAKEVVAREAQPA